MKKIPFPGYEASITSKLKNDSPEVLKARHEHFESIHAFTFTDEYRVENFTIPGADGDIGMRIIAPADLPEGAPILLDIHGGAWMAQGVDGDNYRAAMLAKAVPCIAVLVDYRGSKPDGSVHFPGPFMDVVTAYRWLCGHGADIGGDPKRIAVNGNSSGANMTAGLALYIRDHGWQTPCLSILNCPAVSTSVVNTPSYWQNEELHPGNPMASLMPEAVYLGGFDGTHANYYAFPANCDNFEKLGPHFVITAEYDTLRDDGLRYANRLLTFGVPTEIYSAPRVGHCFTGVPHPFSRLVNELMAMSLRREFGLL